MAKIQEEVILVKLSKLVKNGAGQETLVPQDFTSNLEEILQQLVDGGTIVEVEKA